MELSFLLIFWYGILHAFGPDHLTAIADFSIGKNKRKTLMITALFAVGHGVSLFIFAKILQSVEISEEILGYGDVISASVIIGMGVYLLVMVFTDRIQLKTHTHEGKEHIHIWFGKSHEHNGDTVAKSSSLTLGLLMGAGGVRGMLVTLGVVQGGTVDFTLVLAFTLGVMLIFGLFGLVILSINHYLLHSLRNVKRAFTTVGIFSVVVGVNILIVPHSHAGMPQEMSEVLYAHPHPHSSDSVSSKAEQLVAGKQKSELSYQQVMENMGEAYTLMQRGVMQQNPSMVMLGAKMIDRHPAPKEKPWTNVAESDQEAFKQSLLAYNSLLHSSAKQILVSVKKGDWVETNQQLHVMSQHCVSCHAVWKNKVK